MPDTMQTALLYQPHEFRIEQAEIPKIDDTQALIKIKTCGICPSDVRFYTGQKRSETYPINTGHEFAGQIVAIGSQHHGFQVGDRVVTDLRLVCGECFYCRRGVYSYCAHMRSDLVRGGYCEYAYAVTSSLRRIPHGLSYEEASFAEPLACCVHSINQCGVQPGDTVVLIGAGPIGLMHMQIARHQGARTVVCDLIDTRLEAALGLGADLVINVQRRSALAELRALTEGRLANVVIVAAGTPQAAELGIELAGVCGVVNLFAGFHPPTDIRINPNDIHYKQLRLIGTHNFTPQALLQGLELLQQGAVRVAPLITHRFALHEIQQGFATVAGCIGLKAMIVLDPSA